MTSSDEVSLVSVSFTSTNFEQVNILIKQVTNHDVNHMIMKKLRKTCKFAFASFCLTQKINNDLVTVNRRHAQRFTRIKDY